MTGRPSRLWRRLGATAPVFTVTAHDTWDDTTVAGMTLTRGAGEGLGVFGNDATVTVFGQVANSHDQPLTVALTGYGAGLLAGKVGNRTAAALTARWAGRIGRQAVTDRGDRRPRTTELSCADWLSELARAELAGGAGVSNPELPDVLDSVLDLADLPAGVPAAAVYDPPAATFGVWPALLDAPVPWSDFAGTLVTNAGNLLHVDRAGVPRARTGKRVAEVAAAWSAETAEPLTRRQCLSPATWEQPTSSPAVVAWTTTEPGPGGTFELAHEVRVGSGARPVRSAGIDLGPLEDPTPEAVKTSIEHGMRGLAHRLGGWAYTVPEVTVDLLRLLDSPVAADRAQAGQLLTLDPLDPVALSYDWPDEVIGLYHVVGITEQISPAGWLLTLRLAPTLHVTGQPSPPVPGLTWDTAYPRGTAWDDPPATTTWSNAPTGV